MLAKKDYEQEVLNELKKLSPKKMQKILTFIHFIKYEKMFQEIDSSQAYFWTKEWQEGERKADKDIKEGRLFGPFDTVEAFKKGIKIRK
ncbi:MAG: hypothetical protein AB1414_19780 [bacterium]